VFAGSANNYKSPVYVSHCLSSTLLVILMESLSLLLLDRNALPLEHTRKSFPVLHMTVYTGPVCRVP
jgi:hypothetical protein